MRKLLPLPIALAPVVHADPAENKRLWDVVCRSLDAGMTRDEIIDGLDVSMPGHSESDWLLLMNYAVMRPEAAWGTPGDGCHPGHSRQALPEPWSTIKRAWPVRDRVLSHWLMATRRPG